jgi:hypothetical protein
MVATSAAAEAGCQAAIDESTKRHRQDKTERIEFRCGPGPLPGKAEGMTLTSKIKFAGISLQAVYLLTWLVNRAGGKAAVLDGDGRAVIEIKPHHAPTLAEFAELHPGRKGKPTSRSTASRWLRELREAGLVETYQSRRGNGYLIYLPAAAIAEYRSRQARKAAPIRHATVTASHPGVTASHPAVTDSSHRRSVQGIDQIDHIQQAQPAGHTVQEPAEPSEADGGGGGDDLIEQAIKTMQDLAGRGLAGDRGSRMKAVKTMAIDAMADLAGRRPEIEKAEYGRLHAAAVVAVERWSREWGEPMTGQKIREFAEKWITAAGIRVNDRQAAVEGLLGHGVDQKAVIDLTASTPSWRIVAAVAEVDAKIKAGEKIANPAGLLVAMLRKPKPSATIEAKTMAAVA